MDDFVFDDALAHSQVTCTFPGLETTQEYKEDIAPCTSLFFPGCSFLNYGMPLVRAVYDFLAQAGRADGISLLCCGKILQYEPMAEVVRPAFEQQFRDHLRETSIKRIVAACPNCVVALRTLLAQEDATRDIEVVPLTVEIADMGYRLDPDTCLRVARQDERLSEADSVLFSVKDSCPDRATGEFAESLRRLIPEGLWVDPAHNRKTSVCCGSLPRAAGRYEAAAKCCQTNHQDAIEAGANAIVTPCMSCSFLLSNLVRELPVFHYLELLFDYRIPWDYADQYMKIRFLFDDADGARGFHGLDSLS